MDLMSNQLLTPRQVEEEILPIPSTEMKLEIIQSPEPKPHTPPVIKSVPPALLRTTIIHKRVTKFVNNSNSQVRPPSPEMGKFASIKINSPSKSKKSSLDKNLEEIREGVLMELLGGEDKGS